MKLIITYDPDKGDAIADGRCQPLLDFIIDEFSLEMADDFKLDISTENFIDTVRLAVVEGKINHKDVEIIFKSEYLKINEYGAMIHRPEGFCDYSVKLAEKTLLAAFQKKKKNQQKKQIML